MGTRGAKWVETHNYRRFHEHRIEVALRTETYGLCVIIRDGAVPDEVQHGGISILRHR